jgi:two-component system, NarL family, response regulator
MSAAAQVPEFIPRSEVIRLLIVDDHSIIRHGLRSLFGSHRDIEVVGEAADREEAIALGCVTQCDVALIDLRLRVGTGLEVIRALAERVPACRTIVLTTYGTEHEVYEAMSSGASGYVLKHAEPAEIVSAVRSVHSGRRYLSPEAAATLSDTVHISRLTERERQVLELLVPGTRNRVIARMLGVAEETIKGHVKSILNKLGVKDRTEAATKAIQRGLIRVD